MRVVPSVWNSFDLHNEQVIDVQTSLWAYVCQGGRPATVRVASSRTSSWTRNWVRSGHYVYVITFWALCLRNNIDHEILITIFDTIDHEILITIM